MSACRHEAWEPVVVAGETVANVCARCLRRLPSTYAGDVEALVSAESEEPVEYVPLPGVGT